MKHYILFYETVDGYVEKRKPYRNAHLELARQCLDDGSMILAGAYDPADGAALVFRGESEAVATDFADRDPYVANGLVKRWWVRKWDVVVSG